MDVSKSCNTRSYLATVYRPNNKLCNFARIGFENNFTIRLIIKKNIRIFFTRPSKEISTKTHLLELSSMIHVVRKQIKCILVNKRPLDISLARLRDLICRVYQNVNDVSVRYYIFQRRKHPLGFQMIYG